MSVKERLKAYLENSRFIRQTCDNPLKKTENLKRKAELEREFWNDEASSYLDNFNEKRFLFVANEDMPSSHKFAYSLFKDVKNKKILDICCGYGFTSVRLAKNDNFIVAIDISPKMIELTRKSAALNKVTDKITSVLMSAEQMGFKDESFDYVVGFGALHHLNLELAGREISRVLKKGGKAVFLEPRLPWRWLIYLRSIMPNKCFESPGGGQLNDKDIIALSEFFVETRVDYFMFFSKLTRFNIFKPFSDSFDRFDLCLVKKLRFMKRLYWAFVLQFEK